jgi:hypothetical protein
MVSLARVLMLLLLVGLQGGATAAPRDKMDSASSKYSLPQISPGQ